MRVLYNHIDGVSIVSIKVHDVRSIAGCIADTDMHACMHYLSYMQTFELSYKVREPYEIVDEGLNINSHTIHVVSRMFHSTFLVYSRISEANA